MSINKYKRPVGYNYDGEPLIIMTEDGATFEFRGGQPVMDAGLENWVTINIGTEPGWWGNEILEPENRIGDSDFDRKSKSTITRSMLLETEQEAKRANSSLVDNGVSARVETEIGVRAGGHGLDFTIKVHKPSGDIDLLTFQKFGLNWLRQSDDPASARITDAN